MKTYKKIAAILLPIVVVFMIGSYIAIRVTNNKEYNLEGKQISKSEWIAMSKAQKEDVYGSISKATLWDIQTITAENIDTLDWGEKERQIIDAYVCFVKNNNENFLTSWENESCFFIYQENIAKRCMKELQWSGEFVDIVFANPTRDILTNTDLENYRTKYKVVKK